MIDTHSHIYSEEFDIDRDEVIQRAKEKGIKHIILPNIDSESLPRMLALESQYPDYCHAAIGLHPTSVSANYEEELDVVRKELERRDFIAIGEIGIDLYWDKTFIEQQKDAFRQQLEWSLEYHLPVIIHLRDSFDEIFSVMEPFRGKGLTGVFHSFGGNVEQAQKIIDFGGFFFGINGIVTFKNSGLAETLKQINPEFLLLETDAPYLTPTPHRGKRNESAYVELICEKLALVYGLSKQDISKITSCNTFILFKKIGLKS